VLLDPFDFDDLTAVVIAASLAEVVRTLQLATIGALVVRVRRQGIVRPPHIATRFGYFGFWNGHVTTF